MNKIQYAVLYTSFLLIANVLSANETKFSELDNLKFGDMKKMGAAMVFIFFSFAIVFLSSVDVCKIYLKHLFIDCVRFKIFLFY